MNASERKQLELALIVSLAEFGMRESNDRVSGHCKKLGKFATRELEKLPPISDARLEAMKVLLLDFGDRANWNGKNKHVVTTASFCLEMIESSEFKFDPKIVKYLNMIVDHFDRAGKAPAPCFWGGAVVAEKWKSVMETA